MANPKDRHFYFVASKELVWQGSAMMGGLTTLDLATAGALNPGGGLGATPGSELVASFALLLDTSL